MRRSSASTARVRAFSIVGALLAAASFFGDQHGALAQTTDAKACADAYVEGQKLRSAGRLVGAREQFTACMAEACPAWMVERCSSWRTEVTSRMPSVTLGARDASGRDLKDVTVTIDGTVSADAPPGHAVALDPGEHRVRFERAGDAPVERTIVVREGEPTRNVVVTMAAPHPDGSGGERGRATDRPSSGPPVPAATWLLGGLALAAAGTSAVFAVRGANDRASFGCDAGCPAGEFARVRNEFIVANVAFGVSLVSIGAAAWIFFATRAARPKATAFAVAPSAAIQRAIVRF